MVQFIAIILQGVIAFNCLKTCNNQWLQPLADNNSIYFVRTNAFDSLDWEFSIAKVNFYRFSLPSLRLIHNYLSHKRQTTRVSNVWDTTRFNPGATLLNIFLTYLLFILSVSDIANFRWQCALSFWQNYRSYRVPRARRMDLWKPRLPMNSFFNSQFDYCL